MTDLATLAIKIDSTSAKSASADLDRLTQSGQRAETATGKVGQASRNASGEVTALGRATQQAAQTLGMAAQSMAGLNHSLSLLPGTVGVVASGIAALAVAMGAGALKAIAYADSLVETADALGLSTQAYQEFGAAAQLAGVKTAQFDVAIRTFQDRLAEAAANGGQAADAFRRLGVSFADTSGNARPAEVALVELADAIKAIENPADRVRVLTDLFGRSGARMGVLLQDGSAGIAKFREEAARLGLVLDDALVREAAAAQDQLDTLGKKIGTDLTRIFLAFAPAVKAATGALVEFFNLFTPGGQADPAARISDLNAKITALNATLSATGFAGAKAQAARELLGVQAQLQAAMMDLEVRGYKATDNKAAPDLLAKAELERLKAQYEALLGALDPLAKAQQEYRAGLELVAKAAANNVGTEEQRAQLLALIAGRYDDAVNKINAAAEATVDLDDATKSLLVSLGALVEVQKTGADYAERINQANAATAQTIRNEVATPQEKAAEALRDYNRLLEQGYISLETYNRGLIKQAEALRDADPAYKAAQKAAEAYGREVERVVGRIADRLTDFAQESLFDVWTGKAQDFWDSFKTFGLRALSQLAAEAAIRPIVLGVVAAGASAIGASGYANAATAALGGGGGGFGGITDILGIGRSIAGLAGSGSAVAGTLGTSGALFGAEIAGATGAGLSGASGLVGGAGGGILGGLGAAMPYLGVGLAIAGLVLPKLLGGKKSVGPTGHTNLDIAGGMFGVGTSGADNGFDPSGTREAVAQAAQALNALRTTYGLSVAGPYANFANTGGQFGIAGGAASGPKSAAELVFQVLRGNQYSGGGILAGSGNVGLALANSKGTTAEAIEADLALAKAFDDFVASAKAANDNLSPLRQQLKQSADDIDALRQSVQGLGIATSDLDAIEQQRIDKLRGTFATGIEDAILALTDPLELARRQEQRRYEQQLDDAKALNADLARVDELHRLNLLEIQKKANDAQVNAAEEAARAVRDRLAQSVDSLLLSDLSPFSFSQKQTYAAGRYQSTLLAAQGGDATALGQIGGIAEQYLGLVRQNFASGGPYSEIATSVTGQLMQLAGLTPSGANDNFRNLGVALVTSQDSNTSRLIAELGSRLDAIYSTLAANGLAASTDLSARDAA